MPTVRLCTVDDVAVDTVGAAVCTKIVSGVYMFTARHNTAVIAIYRRRRRRREVANACLEEGIDFAQPFRDMDADGMSLYLHVRSLNPGVCLSVNLFARMRNSRNILRGLVPFFQPSASPRVCLAPDVLPMRTCRYRTLVGYRS